MSWERNVSRVARAFALSRHPDGAGIGLGVGEDVGEGEGEATGWARGRDPPRFPSTRRPRARAPGRGRAPAFGSRPMSMRAPDRVHEVHPAHLPVEDLILDRHADLL